MVGWAGNGASLTTQQHNTPLIDSMKVIFKTCTQKPKTKNKKHTTFSLSYFLKKRHPIILGSSGVTEMNYTITLLLITITGFKKKIVFFFFLSPRNRIK
jgi:hypothetical protein